MIHYKTNEEIEKMRIGGKILSDVLWEVVDLIKPGVAELEIEALADKLISEKGGEAAFKKVRGYKYATCISTNNVVVHGIPSDYKLKEGDIIGVDCGVFYKGFNTDMSETIRVSGRKNPSKSDEEIEIDKFLEVGKKALSEAIKVAVPGNRIGHISKTIQNIVEEEAGYGIVRSLIGHGVGKKLHEEPEVPGYLDKKI
jgi:methionyl aminopeptidase